ncbi:xylulokinase [Virgibacillus natechei]|uniref:Xylulokinase n=1 Tax=Virgibacillus natechei TaxID=1216297 RepID=A0ABS4IIM6_9BACI|nr:FGGY family carbohydrate kinase [Virgibacillus natechei]MBP1970797.1 xylulokinase [Virgibacillus natechei]UZD12303.1 FGGY family carbohydrate kinase [Virgibacillus natechei]
MEEYVGAFDIGTTAIKGVLVNNQATIIGEYSILLDTYYGENGEIEQSPTDWWQGVKEITQKWWSELKLNPKQIVTLTFSGQMEDVISISSTYPNQRAILYSDTRSEQEAAYIMKKLPTIHDKTGNTIRSSTPLAKLLWLKENNVEVFDETQCFVFSSKDYAVYKLTNAFVTDPTTATTTGMMSLNTRDWIPEILETFGLSGNQLPKVYSSEEIVGYVSKAAAEETGLLESTPVLCGSGDAGASTMGAAAVNHGDTYFYIGTTGWAAIVQDSNKQNKGINTIFNLAHLPESLNISIAPVLNAGNVHKWAVETFANEGTDNKYEEFDALVETIPAGSNGLLFLPYLNGERCPVSDTDAKGAFWGIGPKTKKSDMARAVIEGICYSYKQLIDLITNQGSEGLLTLIGGGSKSSAWCQILADVIGRPVRVPIDSEYMPALGISSSAFVSLGWSESYNDFSKQFLVPVEAEMYEPDMVKHEVYEGTYQQYLKLYPNLKGIYD